MVGGERVCRARDRVGSNQSPLVGRPVSRASVLDSALSALQESTCTAASYRSLAPRFPDRGRAGDRPTFFSGEGAGVGACGLVGPPRHLRDCLLDAGGRADPPRPDRCPEGVPQPCCAQNEVARARRTERSGVELRWLLEHASPAARNGGFAAHHARRLQHGTRSSQAQPQCGRLPGRTQ